MKILLTNDDGVFAPGLSAMAEAALTLSDEVTVVAPSSNRSAASHSLTVESPLRMQRLTGAFPHISQLQGVYSVHGTPVDCIHLAMAECLSERPDLVISGINAGPNLGDDVFYSGTVAAAMTARALGIPAVAVSLNRERALYGEAAKSVIDIIRYFESTLLDSEHLWNINIPAIEKDQLKGWLWTRLGRRHPSEPIVKTQDPRGRTIFWVGAPGEQADAGKGTDFYAIEHGYISISPLKMDLTDYDGLAKLQLMKSPDVEPLV